LLVAVRTTENSQCRMCDQGADRNREFLFDLQWTEERTQCKWQCLGLAKIKDVQNTSVAGANMSGLYLGEEATEDRSMGQCWDLPRHAHQEISENEECLARYCQILRRHIRSRATLPKEEARHVRSESHVPVH